jgi:hypothetical protein
MREAVNKSAAVKPEKKAEPFTLRKRIGSTTFVVSVRFSETNKETMGDKIIRLIQGSHEIEDFVGRGGATEQASFSSADENEQAKSATTREAA